MDVNKVKEQSKEEIYNLWENQLKKIAFCVHHLAFVSIIIQKHHKWSSLELKILIMEENWLKVSEFINLRSINLTLLLNDCQLNYILTRMTIFCEISVTPL